MSYDIFVAIVKHCLDDNILGYDLTIACGLDASFDNESLCKLLYTGQQPCNINFINCLITKYNENFKEPLLEIIPESAISKNF
jgi:hypothetical protein